jgi:hypothetical protein
MQNMYMTVPIILRIFDKKLPQKFINKIEYII